MRWLILISASAQKPPEEQLYDARPMEQTDADLRAGGAGVRRAAQLRILHGMSWCQRQRQSRHSRAPYRRSRNLVSEKSVGRLQRRMAWGAWGRCAGQ